MKSRAKKFIKKILIKALNMEFDTEERQNFRSYNKDRIKNTEATFDESKIPKVVDGSGDTPGPNHKQDIGRTWVSAQMAGGVSPFLIDIRPPNEVIGGMLPHAILLSGEAVKNNLSLLPSDKNLRVTVYDQTGELGSHELASWLRDQGWSMARKLRGGFAEWLEHDEPIVTPPKSPGKYQIGDPISVNADHGFVHKVLTKQDQIEYEVWVEHKGIIGVFAASDIQQASPT